MRFYFMNPRLILAISLVGALHATNVAASEESIPVRQSERIEITSEHRHGFGELLGVKSTSSEKDASNTAVHGGCKASGGNAGVLNRAEIANFGSGGCQTGPGAC